MKLNRITLTGADKCTDIDVLVHLVKSNKAVEIGLLYTKNPEGRPRYPSRDWLATAARALEGRCAIHVCGGEARRELMANALGDLTRFAPRVQVNGVLDVQEAESLAMRVDTLITQYNGKNLDLLKVKAKNHSILVDGSAGQGISPANWEQPETHKPVGFAGGLGPDNMAFELDRLRPIAREGSWVDMEGKLRVDDWFSITHAAKCIQLFQAFQAS